jgi:serine/threonine protein kinase
MAWQIGDKLKDGKYTIHEVLGHGGFGQTYVALRNANHADKVVLKHLKKEEGEDDKTFRDRQTAFSNEAMRLASCKHPHIVKVYPENFWQGDFMHMVMEHIEGENLEILLKQRQQPFSIDEALRYIRQVANALDHIHDFKPPLIHRDVKPDNIVLRQKSREVVLIDFGSAKEVRLDTTVSTGTKAHGYSPIEIHTGDSKRIYPRSDVYSLAATLYFLLTATTPMSAIERANEKDDPLIPPIEHNSNIPLHVNKAIVDAMERYADERVQTVTEFMQRLGQPLKPSIIHQALGLFGAKVAPSNPQVEKEIAEQAAKIAAAEKQAKLERQRREQVEQESQAIKKQLQQLEADKQRLAREQQRTEAERQQRQQTERENAKVQLQQLEADKQRLATELKRANAEKERQAQAAREAQVKAEQAQREKASRDLQVKSETQLFQEKIELRSAKGIDYRELEKSLKAKEWRSADELTAKLMLKVANRESQGWLDADSIKIFPCEDLRTIDQLWVHYSNSKFGFSIQKKLWLECGGEIGKYDYEVFKKFAAKVGWYHPQNNDWRTYTEFMNNTKNAQNAVPASLPLGELGYLFVLLVLVFWSGEVGYGRDGVGVSFLSQRLVDCSR